MQKYICALYQGKSQYFILLWNPTVKLKTVFHTFKHIFGKGKHVKRKKRPTEKKTFQFIP